MQRYLNERSEGVLATVALLGGNNGGARLPDVDSAEEGARGQLGIDMHTLAPISGGVGESLALKPNLAAWLTINLSNHGRSSPVIRYDSTIGGSYKNDIFSIGKLKPDIAPALPKVASDASNKISNVYFSSINYLSLSGAFVTNASLNQLEPIVYRSLKAQRAAIKNLEFDWDGYGSLPLPSRFVDKFFDDLVFQLHACQYRGPLPEIVPGSDGSLQVEVRSNSAELIFGMNDAGEKYAFVIPAGSTQQFSEDKEAVEAFSSALRNYFRAQYDRGSHPTSK